MVIDMLRLAAKRRQKLFATLGDDVGAVISCSSNNKGYLSGYHSVAHDLSPSYMSAVVATRKYAALVVSAADAGPALELLKNPELLFRYGLFFFESTEALGALDFDKPGLATFDAALTAAVGATILPGMEVGIDRSDGGYAETFMSATFDSVPCRDVTGALQRVRSLKLDEEVELIRAATKLVEDGLTAIASDGEAGMTEWDLAALLSERMVAGGGLPRLVSVTSGPRSALADAYPSFRRVHCGDLVRVDAGCFVGGFSSDMARTFVVGEPDSLVAARHKAIAAGLELELSLVKAGASVGAIYAATVEAVRNAGIPSYRRQHVGHGLGLGGYEQPIINESSRAVLEAGMCLCVETPYYQLGWGGMMVEDTVLVTDSGYQPITMIPRELKRL